MDQKNKADSTSQTPDSRKKRQLPKFLRWLVPRNTGTTTTSVFSRTLFLSFILGFIAFAALIVKLFDVQLVNYEVYQQKAVSQQTRNEIITPSRGSILDRNGKQLAVSSAVETVIMNPKAIKDEEQKKLICNKLSSILDVDYDTIKEKADKKDKQYEYVARKIDIETADEIREFTEENKLTNVIYMIEDTKRYYPYGNFLSHVLGFCGTDNNGLYGLEYYFNEELNGEPGRIISAKNGRGVDMPFTYEQFYDAVDGDSLELTVDEVVQHYLEQHIRECYESCQANVGVLGLVMDVTNADLLGMCVMPDFDLNNPYKISESYLKQLSASLEAGAIDEEDVSKAKTKYLQTLWSNRAVNTTYEPGSVFKIITGSMALEENIVGSNEMFYCGGSKSITLSERDIGCWSTYGHGYQTFTQGVMHSCNCMFINLGLRLGPATFFKYFKAFGLTEKTGITLPGEAGGSSVLYHDEDALKIDVQLGNSAFGQSFKVTPVQIITAVSAVANGGTLYQPRIVNRVLAADGTVKQDSDPIVVRQVVTEATSKRMNEALEQVVSGEDGTGRNAYVKGYRVAGKTGTSQKLDVDQGESLRIVSFLAYAPADDPKVAVLVVVDEPTRGTVSGGALAAPVAADILADVLPYVGVEPEYSEEEKKTLEIYTPDFTDMTRDKVESRAALDGLNYKIYGDGETVTDQLPAVGTMIPRDQTIRIYMGEEKPTKEQKAPNLVGMTYRGIEKLMKGSMYYLRPVGLASLDVKVACVKQDPAPGELCTPGTVITLSFVDDTLVE